MVTQRSGSDRLAAAEPATLLLAASAPGRRERKKQDTRRRIFEAAESLFRAKGYDSVTVQEIADLADVGVGSVFRHAQNKAELFIMVMNEFLRLGVERGLALADAGRPPVESIIGLVEPLVVAARDQRENVATFQREVLFGSGGPFQREAIAHLTDIQKAIATILRRHLPASVDDGGPDGGGPDDSGPDDGRARSRAELARMARTIFSVLYLHTVRLYLGMEDPDVVPDLLRDDVGPLVEPFLAVPRRTPGPPGPLPG
jgi:AcrR family transcriptional regulator